MAAELDKKDEEKQVNALITRARPLAARVLKWVSLLSVVDCRLSSVSQTGSLINRYICVHLWII